MEKIINVGGRLHNPVVGGAITGADEIKDDTKGKMQNVINQETDAELLRLDGAKQDKLTFDQMPTENSTNPVTSGGVYTADAALQQAIEAILLLIPSAASALNQLADKSFVNSSIATATATFRGTYNLVTDLELTVSATHQQIATALASVVSTADNNDYCFVQIPVSDQSADIRVTERYKFDGTSWEYEYDLNNSGFTADQWGAINSGITSVLVGKLGGLPTAQELATMFNGKQNTLTFDTTPTSGSNNPVTSGGLYSKFATIDAMIPAGADANNKLVAESRLVAYVTTLINALDATFDVTSADGHVTLRMTQADGVITSVQILTSDIASASALTTLGGRVSTAEADIDALQDAYAALTKSDVVIVNGALPSSGQQQNIIYRQPDQDHTPPQYYSDYMWNGTTWVLMATYMNTIDPRPKKGSQNLVTSGGVFDNMGALDVSELNATENPHTLATYADLSAALAAIPSDYQKGGMSIKFVQSSDNKYVQYRLMSDSFNTTPANWQGVSEELKVGSFDVAKSCDVINYISKEFGFENKAEIITDFVPFFWGGDRVYPENDSWKGILIPLIEGVTYTWNDGALPVVFNHIPSVGDTDGISVKDPFTATSQQKFLLVAEPASTVSVNFNLIGFGKINERQRVSKNIINEDTQILGYINIESGVTYTIECGGNFYGEFVIIATDAALTNRLIQDSDFQSGKVYKVTPSVSGTRLYIYMSGNTSLGTLTLDIYNDLYKKVVDNSHQIIKVNDRIDSVIGTSPNVVTLSSDDYVDLLYDQTNHKLISVPHSSTWNCVAIPVQYGFTYKISGGIRAFKLPVPPYADMSDTLFVENDIDRITINEHTTKYLLIQTNTELYPTITVTEQKNGYIDLSEYSKIGICLGDSNMQATSISVHQNEDPASIMGQILGATIYNGGIGGTTYAEAPLNFTELCDAIKTRDFTQFDTDLNSFITAYPDMAFLRDRWSGIKSIPITDVDFVVIAYGTNDWTASRTIDNPNDAFDKTTILGALRYGVKTLLEANPKLRLYIMTPAYRFELFDDSSKDSDNTQINGVYLYEICDDIYDCCRELHTPCLNYYYTCGLNQYNRDAILIGGTHRTKYGYELMAQQYAKFILSY